MPKTPVQYIKVVAFRMTAADAKKLERLCHATQQGAADTLRCLIRLAEPSGVPLMTFTATIPADQSEDVTVCVEE